MALWKDPPSQGALSPTPPSTASGSSLWRDVSATAAHSTVAPVSSPTPASVPRSKKVFIVHGHDDVAKTQLELFLHEIGLQPIVLHRQADEGLTIIEKFEKHSDVGYAFVLLTSDEIAYLAADDGKPDRERQKEARARPNVIFEFGYFVGKLGRSRVCCLHTGTVSLPSDVSGVIYKRYERRIDDSKNSRRRDTS
jgi:predicted nucleotide-binding protein